MSPMLARDDGWHSPKALHPLQGLRVLLVAGAPGARGQSGADFTRMVFVGDSLTAGFQDGALHAEGQQSAYPVLVARSVGTEIVLPLIDEPGVPDPNPASLTGLLLLRPDTCSILGLSVASGRSAGRLNPTERATDVAVWSQTGDILPPLSETDPPKGVAEVVMIPVVGAIVNGIAHAIGHRFTDLPVTPQKIQEVLA